MRKIVGILYILIMFSSCVTRRKYEALNTDIASKQKAIAKLELKHLRLQNINIHLKDSADKLR